MEILAQDGGGIVKLDWDRGELAEGLRCYRAEEFFLAHEHWEGVWLKSEEPTKTFLQALIQIAAAFHHLQRGNPQGTESLLRAALRRLDPFAASFGGIVVDPLREEVGGWLQTLEAHNAPLDHPFPQIRLDASAK
ncbi:MAG: DUF309 domain-containing protein [Edaphobacter sp.]